MPPLRGRVTLPAEPLRENGLTLPHATRLLDAIRRARDGAGHLFVGLDYDGTLTGIVPRPEDAHLPAAARAVLERLVARPDTTLAFLSGRALADVRERVAVEGAYYAGNHGLEIEGPGLHRVHPEAATSASALARVAGALEQAFAADARVAIEHKGITLSVHYRTVRAAEHDGVRDVALRIAAAEPALRATEGKCVVEVRPRVDWHKGAALRFIRASLPDPDSPALFIGDDVTDEDAFRALPAGGWGIIVAERLVRGTAAHAWLHSPGEVVEWLAELGE